MTTPPNMTRRRIAAAAAAAAAALALASVGPAAAQTTDDPASTGPDAAVASFAGPSPSASVANDTLSINGTNRPDTIVIGILPAPATPNILVVDLGNGAVQQFDRLTFSAILVSLHGGDDQFTAQPGFADERVSVFGGRGADTIEGSDGSDLIFGDAGNDTIRSGSGDDIVLAGSGADFVDGGIGRDVAFLEGGHDAFQWDPGDGSDVVEGGSGTDTLEFNGSNASERTSLSAVGPRAVFLRDLGGIRMDLNGIERLDLTMLSGTDTMTVNDLTGTDLHEVVVDLSAAAGAPDGVADVVTVNGTEKADRAAITADGAQVDIVGLKTRVRIGGTDPIDRLQVNTLGGNDRVHVADGVAPLITVTTDLGSGQR
ncbi:MAG: calcium-binding protein [Acidimicrobiales bacterium]